MNEKEPTIHDVATLYAEDAVTQGERFGAKLDFSPESISLVEQILEFFYQATLKEKPSDKDIDTYSKIFGFYVGETFRRNSDKGEWKIGEKGTETEGAHILDVDGIHLLFIGKAYKRIINGSEDNIADFYSLIWKKYSGK